MMAHSFAEHDLIGPVFSASAWLAVGTLIGTFYFMALHWNVRIFAVRQSLTLALALLLIRFGAITGTLALIATHFGALPLLAGTVGIQVGKAVVVRFRVQP